MGRGLLRLFVGIIVLGFWVVYVGRSWKDLAAYRWQPSYEFLAAALILYMLAWVGLGLGWQQTLLAVGGTLSPLIGLRIWVLSTFMRYAPGNVWHILGRVYLAGLAGESRVSVLASSALEQVLTVLSALVVFLVSLPFWPNGGGAFLPLLGLLPVGIGALHPALWNRVVPSILGKLGYPFSVQAPRYTVLLRLGLLYTVYHIVAGLGLVMILASLEPEARRLLGFIIGAQAIAWAAGYLSLLTPGGLGVREGALTLLLAPLLGTPIAAVGSILARLLATLAEALVAGAFGLRRPRLR